MVLSPLPLSSMNINLNTYSGHLSTRQRVSPLSIPELLERIFSFVETYDIVHSVAPVCRQWLLMNRHRLIKEFTWINQASAQGLDQYLQRLQSAGRLCCYFSKDLVVFPLWNRLVGAVKAKHERDCTQSRLDQQLLRADQSTTLPPRKEGSLDIQELLYSPLQELSLRGCGRFELTFPPFIPFLGELTTIEVRLNNIATLLPMSQVLTACPLLERIHFESRYMLILEDPWFVDEFGTVEKDVSHRPPLRLRSLVLLHVHLHQSALDSLLSISPHLTELKLHTWMRNTTTSVIFYSSQFDEFDMARLQAFWSQQKSTNMDKNGCLQQLLLQHRESGKGSTLMFLSSMFSLSLAQALKTMPNMVTTLEIRRDDINTAVRLQDFLCSSPHLLHLLAPDIDLSIHHLDIHQRLPNQWIRVDDDDNSNGRRRPVSQVWACRNLRTLRLGFHRYGSGRIGAPIISRLIFGYISKVCRHVQDLEINGVDASWRGSRWVKRPTLCMRLEGGLCLLAGLRQLRRLRVGSFEAKLECTPSDVDWMVASGHTLTARKARRRAIAGWDSNLAREQQEDLYGLSDPNNSLMTGPTPRPSIVVAVVDWELESQLKNTGLLVDVKTMLLEKMESSDFELWPRLTRAGLYNDMDCLLPVERECFRLTKDFISPNRLSKMFSFFGQKS